MRSFYLGSRSSTHVNDLDSDVFVSAIRTVDITHLRLHNDGIEHLGKVEVSY